MTKNQNYFIRRFLRIVPPYYATIALVLVLGLLFPLIAVPSRDQWSLAAPFFEIKPFLAHLFLVHAFYPQSIFKISPQFWSIGTEAQIYLWLPFAIAPLVRRKSIEWAVIASLIACFALLYVPKINDACLHYAFTFTLGSFVAARIFSPKVQANKIGLSSVLTFSAILLLTIAMAIHRGNYWSWRDLAVSPIFAGILYFLAQPNPVSKLTLLAKAFFASKPMAWLGKISYSIYLTHYVMLGLVHAGCKSMLLSPAATILVMMTLGPLLSILSAWAMQRLVEAPSMKFAKKFREQAS